MAITKTTINKPAGHGLQYLTGLIWIIERVYTIRFLLV